MGLVNGIYQYEGTEDAAPFDDLLNKLGDSVRDRLAPQAGAAVTAAAGYTFGSQVRKVGAEAEFLGGLVARSASSVALAAGTTVALGTVPAGYRPAASVILPSTMRYGAAGTAPIACEVRILSTGVVEVNVTASGTLATTGYILIPPSMRWTAVS